VRRVVPAAASGAISVPWEWLGLLRHPHRLGAEWLVINITAVAMMLAALMQRRQQPMLGDPDEGRSPP
jgi:uncharacterized membrane protein (DUF2068 family)